MAARPEQLFAPLSPVTGVLTSCDRHDLLERTLDSFFATNTFPLRELIIVEDGDTVPHHLRRKYASNVQWLSTGRRVGQIAAIDYAYSRVQTRYIFHAVDAALNQREKEPTSGRTLLNPWTGIERS